MDTPPESTTTTETHEERTGRRRGTLAVVAAATTLAGLGAAASMTPGLVAFLAGNHNETLLRS